MAEPGLKLAMISKHFFTGNQFLEHRPNGQVLLDKHFEFCLSSMLVHLATKTNIA